VAQSGGGDVSQANQVVGKGDLLECRAGQGLAVGTSSGLKGNDEHDQTKKKCR